MHYRLDLLPSSVNIKCKKRVSNLLQLYCNYIAPKCDMME